MSGVPNVFGSATSSIPLSQLDVNFNTPLYIGNTSVGLGNTVTSFGNVTLVNPTLTNANVSISGGTDNGVVYINSSNVAVANPSVLYFNGTNLQVGNNTSSVGGAGTSAWLSVNKPIDSTSGTAGTRMIDLYAYYPGFTNSSPSASIVAGVYPAISTADGFLAFSTLNAGTLTEAGRFDYSGNLLVGTTSQTSFEKLSVSQSGNGQAALFNATNASQTQPILALYAARNTTNNSFYFLQCYNTGASANKLLIADSGNVTNANNSYGAISDVKLKENIVDATPKLADLLKVQVRNYNLKSDSTNKQLGVVAQELETVFPAMVEETIDTDKDGKDLGTTTKSVKYSVFVPMLIKAIQELSAEVAALKAKVGA